MGKFEGTNGRSWASALMRARMPRETSLLCERHGIGSILCGGDSLNVFSQMVDPFLSFVVRNMRELFLVC